MPTLDVYLGNTRNGTLSGDERGLLSFSYDPNARPLSLSMPLRSEPYEDAACRPFFAGLLPEGRALDRILAELRLSPGDTFGLLEQRGGECAGAVRVLPPDREPEIPNDYEPLDGVQLDDELAQIRDAPAFARDRRTRLSLAGAQAKTAVRCTDDARLWKPLSGSPSTHILKVGSRDYPTLPQNESFCLELAGQLGIDVPAVEMRERRGVRFLLVTRYDREVTPGRVLEMHQEDLCQALGYLPSQKYEVNDSGVTVGPSLEACAGVFDRLHDPIGARTEFARRVIFNYLIGNADAHAKNTSILYGDGEPVRLAPAYDLVCTAAFQELAVSFAMRHGGVLDPAQMDRGAWDRTAINLGVNDGAFAEIARTYAATILDRARALMRVRGYPEVLPYHAFLATIGERATQLGAAFGLDLQLDVPYFQRRGGGWQWPS
jgi:serine/threonine-protein kinase HipA